VIQVRPPPDAANAETIHSFQPSGKFFSVLEACLESDG